MKQKKTEPKPPTTEEISQILERQSLEISEMKRELEIEAALEKVRVQALGMREPDDLLYICEILYLELYKMGFDELRNAMINIYEEDKTYFINYDFAPGSGKTVTRMPYDLHPLIHKQVKETKNTADAFSEFSFAGKDLTDFRELRKNNGERDDPKLDESSSLYYYFYSIGTGSIGISTYGAITLEKLSLLKRFRNVFNLSYQRYADIAKAEAQAREAQIEAALEKVRSAANAMQTSDELLNVIKIVGQQLEKLGLIFDSTNFRTNVGEKDWRLWIYAKWMDQPKQWFIPQIDHPYFSIHEKEGEVVSHVFTREEKDSFEAYLFQLGLIEIPKDPAVAARQKEFMEAAKGFAWSIASIKSVSLNIANSQAEPYTLEENALLLRFTIAFEQAYTRFLDLQKAEAQSREAQIELGLERVRARAMAMQHSEELKDLIDTVFTELTKLDIVLTRCLLMIYDPITKGSRWWMANSEAQHEPIGLFVKYHEHPPYLAYLKAWEEKAIRWQYNLQGQIKKDWDDFLFSQTELSQLPDFVIAGMKAPGSVTLSASFNNFGNLTLATLEPLSEEHSDILLRFAKVFDLTYTRFNDLQKAEAQSREAQIELALERVRARTMAMQNTGELLDVIVVVSDQLEKLGLVFSHTNFRINEGQKDWDLWSHFKWMGAPMRWQVPYFDHPFFNESCNNIDGAINQRVFTLAEKQSVEKYLFENGYIAYPDNPGSQRIMDKYLEESTGFAWSCFRIKELSLAVANPYGKPYTEEENKIIQRFTVVFVQAYTRFLDLQKAEAQAREAQIEAALERVRSRSMGMQKSNELAQVVHVMDVEIARLGIQVDVTTINTDFLNNGNGFTVWVARKGQRILEKFYVPEGENQIHQKIRSAIENGIEYYSDSLLKAEKDEYYQWLYTFSDFKRLPEERKQFILSSSGSTRATAISRNSFLVFHRYSLADFTEEDGNIFKRFAKAFEQAYTRFLDLQKAEAQAREAQIENALEKIRSRSLAMHKSDELKEVVNTVYERIKELSLDIDSISIIVTGANEQEIDYWVANEDESYPSKLTVPIESRHKNNNPIYIDFFDNRTTQTNFSKTYSFEEKNAYFHYLFKNSEFKKIPEERKQFLLATNSYALSIAYTKNSALVFAKYQEKTYSEEENKILQRFANVFEQSYIRFLDLQKAEAQARESQIEAALEKVRSRTLAMQKSDELAETAAEVFRQLIILGIEPNRLYIGIIKEEEGDMEMWATDEDGTQVGRKFMFNKNENASVNKLYEGWVSKQKSVIVNMEGKELEDYFHYLNHVMHIPFKDGLTQKRRVQSVAYFSKGFIGMASPDGQGDETIQLLERFAAVFNLTFTRFNDLKIAEAHAEQAELDLTRLKEEKKRTEDALNELQITQKQLIQAEKMASLGELTAGIAHEIQNPLNFVNNFSEVSTELVDEMNEEIRKGNLEDAQQIAKDLKDNLSKINHHGKRAGDIVKGMLQHSRSSNGVKEPTDINALTDEYLRLAYHGLRAKDKSFNATLITEFDDSIGMINMIPQDMGRVILNLITNAFYAVDEKKKTGMTAYEPTVSITTKKTGNQIFISVKDNGKGIPKQIVDKIFQPFFTTKPTGQGTGLGLSLSYDIVKAHGGEITVSSKLNEGSEFIMSIPNNNNN